MLSFRLRDDRCLGVLTDRNQYGHWVTVPRGPVADHRCGHRRLLVLAMRLSAAAPSPSTTNPQTNTRTDTVLVFAIPPLSPISSDSPTHFLVSAVPQIELAMNHHPPSFYERHYGRFHFFISVAFGYCQLLISLLPAIHGCPIPLQIGQNWPC